MSEEQQGDVQDPSEPYETGTQTETSDQPENPSDEEVTTGGELNHAVEPAPVEVAPEEPNADPETIFKTTKIHGDDYEISPEAGHRRI